MNKSNNSRAEHTKKKIKDAFIYLLKHKSFDEIFVKDICKIACINRSSFYFHYQDINDLIMKTEAEMSDGITKIFRKYPFTNEDYLKMFEYVKENKEFYLAYLSLNECVMEKNDLLNYNNQLKNNFDVAKEYGHTPQELFYHIVYSSGGLRSICKAWLMSGTKETPEQMAKIIHDEYSKN